MLNSDNENGSALNLTPEHFGASKSLSKHTISLSQNRIEVILLPLLSQKMLNMLSDSSKFSQISVSDDKQLNFIVVNVKERVTDLVKVLKKSEAISETVYENLKLWGSRFGILYGLSEVHKRSGENCPPCRLNMSGVKTSSYDLARLLAPQLEPINTNMYTVKNSFRF